MEEQQNFNLKSALEALFFIANRSLNKTELAKFCGRKIEEIEEPLNQLIDDYQNRESGIKIIQDNQEYQMVTNSNYGPLIQKFLKQEVNQELTPASLETLSIIAYRGPIAKLELERIRGINCSLIIRNLLLRGLIEEKFDNKKNEHFYTVTHDFVRFLGISEISSLPDYEKLNKAESLAETLGGELTED